MTATILTSPTTNQQPQTTKRGWVNTFYRHYRGKKLGPYHVRRWKVGAKIHKEYIKPADFERVKAECLAYREQRKRGAAIGRAVTNIGANLDYLFRMDKWQKEGKLRPQDVAFIHRIAKEGPEIDGGPPTRRGVTRHLARVAGQRMIVKSVFEIDGTTKVFMVPLVANIPENPFDQLKRMLVDAWEKVHGRNIGPPGDDLAVQERPNPWMEPHL
jgi:hypothetical protein